MHFFYLDESGDTGLNLADPNQPIFVLGGLSLRDEGWNATHEEMTSRLNTYFAGAMPMSFELHAKELLSTNGDGPFAGQPLQDRAALAESLLKLVNERKHAVHFFAIDKSSVAATNCAYPANYDLKAPYLVAFDYLVTYINWLVRERLGRSARGMMIFDHKPQFHDGVEAITRGRRFDGPLAHRVKWIVEFSYAVDSLKNPMIQLSDLICYCVRRFLEIDHGHHPNWTDDAKRFYAGCYALIANQIDKVAIESRGGRDCDQLDDYISAIRSTPRVQWRKFWL